MKILVADDHSVVRKGIIQVVEDISNDADIDEAVNGFEVLEKLNDNDYQLVILDISMPGKNGLDVLKDIKIIKPKLNVLILSTFPEEMFALRSFKAGASGYLSKNSAADELESAIKTIIKGGKYVSGDMAQKLVTILDGTSQKQPHEQLTDREFEVFRLFASGKSSSQIANELSLSSKTVSSHKKNIFRKMKMSSTAEMVHYAIDNHLLE